MSKHSETPTEKLSSQLRPTPRKLLPNMDEQTRNEMSQDKPTPTTPAEIPATLEELHIAIVNSLATIADRYTSEWYWITGDEKEQFFPDNSTLKLSGTAVTKGVRSPKVGALDLDLADLVLRDLGFGVEQAVTAKVTPLNAGSSFPLLSMFLYKHNGNSPLTRTPRYAHELLTNPLAHRPTAIPDLYQRHLTDIDIALEIHAALAHFSLLMQAASVYRDIQTSFEVGEDYCIKRCSIRMEPKPTSLLEGKENPSR